MKLWWSTLWGEDQDLSSLPEAKEVLVTPKAEVWGNPFTIQIEVHDQYNVHNLRFTKEVESKTEVFNILRNGLEGPDNGTDEIRFYPPHRIMEIKVINE